MAKTRNLRIKVVGDTQDVPFGLRAEGIGCAGDRYYYVAAPTKGKAVMVRETTAGMTMWQAGKSSDVPRRSKSSTTAEKAVKALKAVQEAIPKTTRYSGPLKGTWRGYVECHTGFVDVVLYRNLVSYGKLVVVGKHASKKGASPKWVVAIRMAKKWYSKGPGVLKVGSFSTLKAACDAGYKAMAEVVKNGCMTKATRKSPKKLLDERRARRHAKTGDALPSSATTRKQRNEKRRTAAVKGPAAAKRRIDGIKVPPGLKRMASVDALKGTANKKAYYVIPGSGRGWAFSHTSDGSKGKSKLYRSVKAAAAAGKKNALSRAGATAKKASAAKKETTAKKAPAKTPRKQVVRQEVTVKMKGAKNPVRHSGTRRIYSKVKGKYVLKKGKSLSSVKIGGRFTIKVKGRYLQGSRVKAVAPKAAPAKTSTPAKAKTTAPWDSPSWPWRELAGAADKAPKGAAKDYKGFMTKYGAAVRGVVASRGGSFGDSGKLLGAAWRASGKASTAKAQFEAVGSALNTYKPAAKAAWAAEAAKAPKAAVNLNPLPGSTQTALVGTYITFKKGGKTRHGKVLSIAPNGRGSYVKKDGGAKLTVSVGGTEAKFNQFSKGKQSYRKSTKKAYEAANGPAYAGQGTHPDSKKEWYVYLPADEPDLVWLQFNGPYRRGHADAVITSIEEAEAGPGKPIYPVKVTQKELRSMLEAMQPAAIQKMVSRLSPEAASRAQQAMGAFGAKAPAKTPSRRASRPAGRTSLAEASGAVDAKALQDKILADLRAARRA